MRMTWDELQTVEALVRTGSVIATARELGLRHSSVSRRIDALERTLGAPLFLRGARLRPTALALTIAGPAAEMANRAVEIDRLVQRQQRERERRLVITTNDVLVPLVFGALAEQALQHLVQVRVSDVEAELEPGITDLALRPGGQPRGSLRGWPLGRLRVGVYRAKSRRERDSGWVLPSSELRGRTSMRWWKAVPQDAPGRVECDSLLAIRDACVAGLGLAVMPSVLAGDDARLQLVEELDAGPPVWLLAPATRSSDKALREVAQRLVTSIRNATGAWR